MHRVTDPSHLPTTGGHFSHDVGKHLPDLSSAHSSNEGDPSGFMVRIKAIGQFQCVVCGGRRAELDTKRVTDVAEEFHMCTVQLPGALADPQEVSGGAVGLTGAGVDPSKCVLVLQDQRLVA